MEKGKFRLLKENTAGFLAVFLGLHPIQRGKKKSGLLSQIQEFFRIHGLVIMGNTEMDMTAER